ncbi:ASCH domain-containing protein [Halorussus limi]|uniref:ASCH domain-containing protein n=1 Tax=Halorussus limi TaxID=2938695 RepID=A0A8U0HPK9_9EURY|nr:ASCH domain-containing protein [Halorussus limi]UPV72801.1 ASCH domain-containing protein [Halorussus limi]
MAEIEADTLLPNDRMRSGARDGEITQIHRGRQYAEEGDRFEADGEAFEVVEVRERTLGDLTDEDARKEGMRDLEQYREILNRAHDDFQWDDDSDVVLHRFEKVES